LQKWPPEVLEFRGMCLSANNNDNPYNLPSVADAWCEAVSVMPHNGDKYSHIVIERAAKLTNAGAYNGQTLGSCPFGDNFLKPKFEHFYKIECAKYQGENTPITAIENDKSTKVQARKSKAQEIAQNQILAICKSKKISVLEAFNLFKNEQKRSNQTPKKAYF